MKNIHYIQYILFKEVELNRTQTLTNDLVKSEQTCSKVTRYIPVANEIVPIIKKVTNNKLVIYVFSV